MILRLTGGNGMDSLRGWGWPSAGCVMGVGVDELERGLGETTGRVELQYIERLNQIVGMEAL